MKKEAIQARDRLLETIAAEAADTERWTGRKQFSERTMQAMADVAREAFVAPGDEDVAYVNRPQSIGYGQTISQPFIVALMTDLLGLKGGERVLEIGTGSGYQAAVLAEMSAEIFSVETVAALAVRARENLARAGYRQKVHVREGDGFEGWPEEAPFDAVIVTAAPERMPKTLVKQLKPGGRIVVPIGARSGPQMLHVVKKLEDATLDDRSVLPVAFVPMVHRTVTDGTNA